VRSGRLARPELLANTEGLRLDWGAFIAPYGRLECVLYDGRLGSIEIGEGSAIHAYFHCDAAKRVTTVQRGLIASRLFITDHDHAMP
jgi:hypothetical protein